MGEPVTKWPISSTSSLDFALRARNNLADLEAICRKVDLSRSATLPESTPHYALLAAIFFHASEGHFVLDNQLRVVLFNPVAAQMTGWVREDPAGIGVRVLDGQACPVTEGSLFNPAECPGADILLALRSPQTYDLELINSAGQRRRMEVTYAPVRREDGSLQFIIGTLRDIEERRALEDQLFQSRKLASLGTLVAGITHELRNPLGIIRSAAQILGNDERTAPQKREAVKLILEETQRLDKLVRDFLAFARPRPARPETTDIVPVIQRFVTLHREMHPGSRVEITERHEQHLPPLSIDEDLMRQVIDNFLSNAGEARPDSERPIQFTITTARHDPRHVRIDFADDGVGMEAEQVAKIFDPFYTTKRDGTGLGLSIVHQIVTQLHGRVTVESQPNAGTTFSVFLPVPEECVH
jgi:signal transduction histidine kinase